MENEPILSIQNLVLGFKHEDVKTVIHGLNLDIPKKKTFVLLGESGCGKSVTAHTILQLLPENVFISNSSKILYEGTDILTKSEFEMQKIRGEKISMIFQDPMSALNPVITIGEQIKEILYKHNKLSKSECHHRTINLLKEVGIDEPKQRINQYPHQFSGGQKQRIMIAMALSSNPNLLIADEPTTALDVTTQAQILYLLHNMQLKYGLSILLITHDLDVAKLMGDVIGVMYAGHLVEISYSKKLIDKTLHPYTKELVNAIPGIEKFNFELSTTAGNVPDIDKNLNKCRYIDRCSMKIDLCSKAAPDMLWHGSNQVRCYLFDSKVASGIQIGSKKNLKELPSIDCSIKYKDKIALSVKNLSIEYTHKKSIFRRNSSILKAVNDISFQLMKGKTLAIVGESGSGKTSTGKAIVDLIKKTAGQIHINGIYLSRLHNKFRKNIQMVFQDVHSSLNPKLTVLDAIIEGLLNLENDPNKINDKLTIVLEQVGLDQSLLTRYPHQLSGGQRQRVSIARSLILSPEILVLDEPTSALDVSIQAQILTLLKKIQQKYVLSYLLISHDISVVSYLADNVAVIYKGRLVEYGQTKEILENPQHPYTKVLLNSVPNNINFDNLQETKEMFNLAINHNEITKKVKMDKISFSDTHSVYYYNQ